MDDNGNKVHTLRQQFEVLSSDENRMQKSKSSSNFEDLLGRHCGESYVIRSMVLGGNGNQIADVKPTPKHLHLFSDKFPDDSAVNPSEDNNRRNGIYVSNSITLHCEPRDDDRQILYPSQDHVEDELGLVENEGEYDRNEDLNDNTSQSGVTVYGKIKRSNAFRKKDIIDSLDPRFVKSKSKLSLERVKSLDTSGIPSSGHQRKCLDAEINRASSVCVRSNVSDRPRQHQTHQQKAINIVTPYQVTDIYSHNRHLHKFPDGGRPHYDPHSHCGEADYSIPGRKSESYSSNNDAHYPALTFHHHLPVLTSTDRPLSVSRDVQPHNKIKETVTKPTLDLHIPPEKPPRTFLYDILSDQAPTPYQQKQSSLIASLDNSKSQRVCNGFYIPPGSSSTMAKSSESRVISQLTADSAKVKLAMNEVNNNAAMENESHVTKESGFHRTGAQQNHQPLVRSKTESQIIVKNKNRVRHPEFETGRGLQRCGNSVIKASNVSSSSVAAVISADYSDFSSGHHRTHDSRMSTTGISYYPMIYNNRARYGRMTTEKFLGNTTVGGTGSELISVFHRTDSATHLRSHENFPSVVGTNFNCNMAKIGDADKRSGNRLCEKSKSEWALNKVLSGDEKLNVVISGERGSTVSNTVENNNCSSCNNIDHMGHLSLDSNASSNNSAKLFRSNIQQSIQNLMNQLFSTSGINGKDAISSKDSGIQLGSESLSSCDTPVGDSTTDTGDSDIENEVETSSNARQVVEARKGYIRQVSSFRVKESQNGLALHCKKPLVGEALFECLLVVGLNRDAYTGTYHPYIKEMFPPNTKLAAGVEQFCFPDSYEWPFHEGDTAQSYTLAITDHRGGRKYGCCFRILPEGASICIPITYCLISSNRAIGFYREVLREITLRHGCNEHHKRYWMEQLYSKPFPLPDEDICIQDPIQEETYVMTGKTNLACYDSVKFVQPRMITIRRRADQRLDDKDLVTLLTKIDAPTVIKIFGSMLHERKVVLISRALSTLSLCVEALESMLYPFTWQHTFVPILPLSMPDFLDAPSPYLIGVLRSSQSSWDKNFDDGMVIDLDMNKVLRSVGDEGSILPKRIHRKLRDSLQFVLSMSNQGESTKNVLFSECFIRMFVDVMGHYGNHIILHQDGAKSFEREAFIRSSDTKATQNFLDWFSETSMFHFFIENRLKANSKQGLFEHRIMGDQTHQKYGAPLPFKHAKLVKNSRTFGINWLRDTFVLKP